MKKFVATRPKTDLYTSYNRENEVKVRQAKVQILFVTGQSKK